MIRGIRNNNPFNLKRSNNRWLGKVPFSESKDKVFETFTSLDYGIRAGMINLCSLISRCRDLHDLVNVYAPPTENDSTYYFNFVHSYLVVHDCSVELDDILRSPSSFLHLCKAIVVYECGDSVRPFLSDFFLVFERYYIRRYMLRSQLNRLAKNF